MITEIYFWQWRHNIICGWQFFLFSFFCSSFSAVTWTFAIRTNILSILNRIRFSYFQFTNSIHALAINIHKKALINWVFLVILLPSPYVSLPFLLFVQHFYTSQDLGAGSGWRVRSFAVLLYGKKSFDCNRLYSERSFVSPSDFMLSAELRKVFSTQHPLLNWRENIPSSRGASSVLRKSQEGLSSLSPFTSSSPQPFTLVNKTINQPT